MMRTNATVFFALVLCAAVSGRMLGGFKTVDDVNSVEYDGLKQYIQDQLSARSNSLTPPQLSEEMQISQQVVAGINYKVAFKDTDGNAYEMIIFKDLSGVYHTESFKVDQSARGEQSARSMAKRVVGGYSSSTENGFDDEELSAFDFYRKNTSDPNSDDLVLCNVSKQVVAGINFKLTVAHGSCNNARDTVTVYRGLDGSMKIV